jgi:hypothetical protein
VTVKIFHAASKILALLAALVIRKSSRNKKGAQIFPRDKIFCEENFRAGIMSEKMQRCNREIIFPRQYDVAFDIFFR